MKRPTSVTVFGILSLVFAAFGLFGFISALLLPLLPGQENNPMFVLMRDNPGYAVWHKVSIGLSLLGTVALALSGVGLLKLRPWGRTLSVGYAIFSIVVVLVAGYFNYLYLFGPMMEQASQTDGAEAAGAIGAAVGAMFGTCFGLLFPILTLIFMTRAKVVAAFQPASASSEPPALS